MKRKIMNKMKNTHIKILLTIIFLIAYSIPLSATIRYVSHTGSSTPPYTTWETAADSIQKCINYSVDGDTIIVANGVYKETLFVNKAIWLLGSSMDSTVIDGRGLNGINVDYLTVEIGATVHVRNFTVIGKAPSGSVAIEANAFLLYLENCKILDSEQGVDIIDRSSIVKNSFIFNSSIAYWWGALNDTTYPRVEGCLILMRHNGEVAINVVNRGNPIISDNIMIGNGSYGGVVAGYLRTVTITNNIITGFEVFNIDARFVIDAAVIQNNITAYMSGYSGGRSISAHSVSNIRNNIVAHNEAEGIISEGGGIPVTDYNLYWDNGANTGGGVTTDSTDVLADPMFVNDTIPTNGGSYNYHLQKYSPAIDAGDPNILDIDSSRSDIGLYIGGSYTYENYAPKPPVNLMAGVEGGFIKLTWDRNSDADTAYYNVYRDTTANFTIDSTKLVSSPTDTFYIEPVPKEIIKFYYKITAVDIEGLESEPSEEAEIILTVGQDEWKAVNNYVLYQNYPNPFNPTTKIGYKLISRGSVKLLVYDITGSLVSVLVNEVQEAGYYEAEFNSGVSSRQSAVGKGIASGIYLYRIEVIGEGNIPRFSDMKKMILIK